MLSIEKYHKRRNLLIQKFGAKCCHCGLTTDLEFHVRGNGTGKAEGGWQHLLLIEKYLLTKEKPVELLCKNCHLKEHKKVIYNKDNDIDYEVRGSP